MRRRRGHSARDTLLVLALGTLAVVAALAWLAEHLAVLGGIALIIGAAYHFGQRGRRQARPAISPRPGQVHTAGPAAAVPLPVAALPLADDRDEAGADRHARGHLTESDEMITVDLEHTAPDNLPTRSDRQPLIAAPMSGCRPLTLP